MSFDDLLAELMRLVGSQITVTLSERKSGSPALIVAGILQGALEMRGVPPGSAFERIFFSFAAPPGGGFSLERSSFGGASCWGSELCIETGNLILRLRPEPVHAIT